MPLQFQAPFQINPYAENPQERSLSNLNQTISGVGDDALKYHQQQIENQRQQAILKIQQAEEDRKAAAFGAVASPPSWGGASQPGASGPSPASSTSNGTFGPQLGTWNTESQSPTPAGSVDYSQGMQGPQPQAQQPANPAFGDWNAQTQTPVDHTAHFMNWKAMGQPTTYDHPDYGGSGQSLGMQPNPMQGGQAAQPGQSAQAPMISRDQYFAMNEPQREAYAKYMELQANYPGGSSSKFYTPAQQNDIQTGKFNPANWSGGVFPKDAVTTAGAFQRQNTENIFKNNTQNTGLQDKARDRASKLYDDYSKKNDSIDQGIASLGQAASNPATFNTSLLQVGEALGIKARNPQRVIDAIARGNPSLLGRLQEASSIGLKGQASQELQQGLMEQLSTLKDQNTRTFENQARNHIKQNVSLFGGNQNQAQSDLFPTYQFGGDSGGAPKAGGQKTYQKVMQNAQGQKVGWDGTKWEQI